MQFMFFEYKSEACGAKAFASSCVPITQRLNSVSNLHFKRREQGSLRIYFRRVTRGEQRNLEVNIWGEKSSPPTRLQYQI